MLISQTFVTLVTLFGAVTAVKPPSYSGYKGQWTEQFAGAVDTKPNSSRWTVISTKTPFNNEWQAYTSSKKNVRLNGSGRLQLTPRRDSSAPRGWTSGRIESKYTFTPTAGKITRIEAQLRIGSASESEKKGIWPAFWMMGQSYRDGVKWPASGEVDIFENVNGDNVAIGVVHCDTYPGGRCNEPIGIPGRTTIGTASWLTWRVEFDLRKSSWKDQSIVWFRNGVEFHRIKGSKIASQAVWKTLVAQPLYIILNVAVGGDFPGDPNSKTATGAGTLMEVGYVAHYVSK